MSGSDDTDILLLIPPDFFVTNPLAAESKGRNFLLERFLEETPDFQNKTEDFHSTSSKAKTHRIMSDCCQFISGNKQTELNQINEHLSIIEKDLLPLSDTSAISQCTTARSHNFEAYTNRSLSFQHSTPKKSNQLSTVNCKQGSVDDVVLHEIDNFLGERYDAVNAGFRKDDNLLNSDLQPNKFALNLENCNKESCMPKDQPFTAQNALISLCDIWGANEPSNNAAFKEEQYRRMHLEKTIRLLQGQLLEYQQRISVAIEVDRSKDAALQNLQQENKNLNQEVCRLRDGVARLETDQSSFIQRYDTLQKELSHALGLAAKFQEKNEKIEAEFASLSRKTTECSTFYEKQIDELNAKITHYEKSEDNLLTETNKIKDKLVKAEYNAEKANNRCTHLEKELETIKHQKELLQDFHQKQKNRADILETQKKTLQDTVTSLSTKESTLSKKIETQRQALKFQYQQQLENVVSQKLQEFQHQLDKVEENLKSEAKDRERLIADRAIKQMELINEKNELEINLLQQKHNEEIELYRIQLANASEKIDCLEEKLAVYKTKRADIAEKLHDIMEAQWQKALEVLTSPGQTLCKMQGNTNKSDFTNSDENRNVDRNRKSTAENEMFETPTRNRAKNRSSAGTESPRQKAQIDDRLRAYIELLLSKSPTDFEKLDEILNAQRNQKSSAKSDKSAKRSTSNKPPWKA